MPEQTEHGSFLTGFTIGLFAGATGYFLFATDQGKKVRKSLVREWQEAQQSWLTDSPEFGETTTLRDLAKDFLNNILGHDVASAKPRGKSKKDSLVMEASSVRKSPAAAVKKNTFKGV